jgi:hypothetical protein
MNGLSPTLDRYRAPSRLQFGWFLIRDQSLLVRVHQRHWRWRSAFLPVAPWVGVATQSLSPESVGLRSSSRIAMNQAELAEHPADARPVPGSRGAPGNGGNYP